MTHSLSHCCKAPAVQGQGQLLLQAALSWNRLMANRVTAMQAAVIRTDRGSLSSIAPATHTNGLSGTGSLGPHEGEVITRQLLCADTTCVLVAGRSLQHELAISTTWAGSNR